MATSLTKPSSRFSKSPTSIQSASSSSSVAAAAAASSLSSHLAMVELKSRILAALSKLSDRDTYQIAVDDLEKIIRTLPPDGFPMLLHALLHDPSFPANLQDPSSKNPSLVVARRESLRLIALLCSSHTDAAAVHLPKIIAHIVRRLKDPASDSSVREACRDAAGSLSGLYLRPAAAVVAAPEDGSGVGGGGLSSPVVALFVKPLFEAMGEQNKAVQGGAAMCLAKVVECAGGGSSGEGEERKAQTAAGVMFPKLCGRICKLLSGQSFLAKAALLSVVSSMAQVGFLILLVS